jgi:hypothetical protein
MAEASGIGGGGGHGRAVPVGSASIFALVSPPVAAPVAGSDRGLRVRRWIVRLRNAGTGGPGSSGRETERGLEVNAVNPMQSSRMEPKAAVQLIDPQAVVTIDRAANCVDIDSTANRLALAQAIKEEGYAVSTD